MKTAISIPDDLFQAAERLANQLGIPRSRLYSMAVEEFVEQRQAEDITRRLDEVYAEESSGVDPFLTELQTRTQSREISSKRGRPAVDRRGEG
jgi:predicted transcriptional regulator